MTTLNYRHLYYFWVVAKEGGFARAAERLDMAIQTISAQVKALEQDLGHQLLKPAGRGVAVTDAGQAVLVRAEEIFQLGATDPRRSGRSGFRPECPPGGGPVRWALEARRARPAQADPRHAFPQARVP